jgi:hypothetical protein
VNYTPESTYKQKLPSEYVAVIKVQLSGDGYATVKKGDWRKVEHHELYPLTVTHEQR